MATTRRSTRRSVRRSTRRSTRKTGRKTNAYITWFKKNYAKWAKMFPNATAPEIAKKAGAIWRKQGKKYVAKGGCDDWTGDCW